MKKTKKNNNVGLVILPVFLAVTLIIGMICTIISSVKAKTHPAYTETTEYPRIFRGYVQLSERVYAVYADTEQGLDALDQLNKNRDGNIILTIENGRLINQYGDGVLDNGYEIHYSDIEGNPLTYPNGSRMQSVCIYNPESNIHDDVLNDYHVCLDDDAKRETLPSCYDDSIDEDTPYLQVYDDTIQDPNGDWTTWQVYDDTVVE